jgi:DNA primase
VRVALLPAGHDPDTFLRAAGAAAFAERIAGARSLLSYALERTIRDADGTGQRARANAFARVALMLSKVGDAEEATALSREAATRLGVDATQLWFEAQRLSASLRKPPAPVGKATTAGPTPADDKKLVTKLVTLLLVDLEARPVLLPLLEPSDVVHPALREIVETLKRLPATPATGLLAELASDEARHMVAALVVEDTTTPDPRVSIEHFRRRLEFLGGRRRVRDLSRSIGAAQASQGVHAPVDDDLLAVQRDSARVYQHQGGSAQVVDRAVDHPHPMGPDGPQGVQGHE